jgi:3,4-dihydroxy 2-butanone 4-phosphate synthase
MSKTSNKAVTIPDDALSDFRDGKPVLVYDADDRESEVDVIYPAAAVEPEDVARLRRDAGGLICVAVSSEVADTFKLPFLADEIDHPSANHGELGYDERSSFSLPVNHREAFTGVTDADRSLTIQKLASAARNPDKTDFSTEFRAPGHVPLLRAAPGLLNDRRGHTEFGVAMAESVEREPAVVVCEMLDAKSGEALTISDARAYAAEHGLRLLEGSELIKMLG